MPAPTDSTSDGSHAAHSTASASNLDCQADVGFMTPWAYTHAVDACMAAVRVIYYECIAAKLE